MFRNLNSTDQEAGSPTEAAVLREHARRLAENHLECQPPDSVHLCLLTLVDRGDEEALRVIPIAVSEICSDHLRKSTAIDVKFNGVQEHVTGLAQALHQPIHVSEQLSGRYVRIGSVKLPLEGTHASWIATIEHVAKNVLRLFDRFGDRLAPGRARKSEDSPALPITRPGALYEIAGRVRPNDLAPEREPGPVRLRDAHDPVSGHAVPQPSPLGDQRPSDDTREGRRTPPRRGLLDLCSRATRVWRTQSLPPDDPA